MVKSGKDYDGKPKNYLGQSFKSFFLTSACVETEITNSDVIVSGLQNVTGTLKDDEQTKF
jgi:hypothetical protein